MVQAGHAHQVEAAVQVGPCRPVAVVGVGLCLQALAGVVVDHVPVVQQREVAPWHGEQAALLEWAAVAWRRRSRPRRPLPFAR